MILGAGFCTIVLMRDAILQELGNWTIWFSRLALYAAEAITVSTYVHQLSCFRQGKQWILEFAFQRAHVSVKDSFNGV